MIRECCECVCWRVMIKTHWWPLINRLASQLVVYSRRRLWPKVTVMDSWSSSSGHGVLFQVGCLCFKNKLIIIFCRCLIDWPVLAQCLPKASNCWERSSVGQSVGWSAAALFWRAGQFLIDLTLHTSRGWPCNVGRILSIAVVVITVVDRNGQNFIITCAGHDQAPRPRANTLMHPSSAFHLG